tara:strand:- start:5180 stop:6346 length:1167 start_codon:yes stop_codon:yes gene_type:complete
MGEKDGVIGLDDLNSKEIFIQLEDKFYDKLERKIGNLGIAKLERKLNSGRKIGHWLGGNSLIRLDILKKVCEYFDIDFENKIVYLRGKLGRGIYDPRLPFNFTSVQGSRVIAGILGDGGLSYKKKVAYYTNSDKDLINGFLNDMRDVFGNIEYTKRDKIAESSVTEILDFPTIIYSILLKTGLKPGKKVETNAGVPEFIFELGVKEKIALLSHFLDDEGHVNLLAKHLALTAGCLEKYGSCKVLEDIKRILSEFDIDCSIRQDSKYNSTKGDPRRIWKLQINGQMQVNWLNENLSLRHKDKKIKLQKLSGSFKLRVFRRKEFLSTYIGFMNEIENEKGYFTSLDLSTKSGMVVGSCRNIILSFQKRDLISCVKPYSRSPHNYGRYRLK